MYVATIVANAQHKNIKEGRLYKKNYNEKCANTGKSQQPRGGL